MKEKMDWKEPYRGGNFWGGWNNVVKRQMMVT